MPWQGKKDGKYRRNADLPFRELIRAYQAGDITVEMRLYGFLLRANMIPQHWLQLLAFFGDDVYDLPPELQPPTGFIDTLYQELQDDADVEPWLEYEFVSPFPFVGEDDNDPGPLLPNSDPRNHQLVVNLVGIYLRQTLGWVFSHPNHPEIQKLWKSIKDNLEERRRRPKETIEDWDEKVKNETRDTVRQLWTWRPGYEIKEIASKTAYVIPDWRGEEDLLQDDYGQERELDHLLPAFSWLLQLISAQIAYPNKYCINKCQAPSNTYLESSRRKTCPHCRGPVSGPHTHISNIIKREAPRVTTAYPYSSFIEASYAVWRHTGEPMETLHAQILPLLRSRIIELAVT